ncbi:thioredoxin domain-containing protein [filamentous cyanobacterium CCP5]|nr:thioredoxin domain-containing protein [filamentous cyanobacterium CCP5]
MPNRLLQSQSLYLRKHGENPIDWWPWCEAALDAARQQNKPIFLSIGYSSCHWCTVMEGEAFADPAIAEYMNAHFLPIKVDREERPDLDSLYMQALQMMTGQGGWPLNVFLSPDDLVPFYGGTYFPLEPKYGRAGFLQVLQTLRRFYDSEPDQLQAVKGEILDNLQQGSTLPVQAPDDTLLRQGIEACVQLLGKAGSGPRFPMIPQAQTALRDLRWLTQSTAETDPADLNGAGLCRQRGLDLALGGIYDHVGGGFHRYTVDSTWTVPHFEKMLYDNGQILEYLADLWGAGEQLPSFERAVEGTVVWLLREMRAETGWFYAAQDADSFINPDDPEPEEGAFYGWDYEELQSLLTPPELAAMEQAFTISQSGNFEGRIVLQRRSPNPLNGLVDKALGKLFYARYGATASDPFSPARTSQAARSGSWPGRIPPVTDTKMIVAWNALMISGLARAAQMFAQSSYLQLATQAMGAIIQRQWVDEQLHRLNYDGEPSVLAQAEDYGLLIKALLDLQQATLAIPDAPDTLDWLEIARDTQAEFDQWLWSESTGGYYNTAADASDRLLVRERSFQDSAIPAANGVAIANLVRLSLLTGDLGYLDRADQALTAFGVAIEKAPQACASLTGALDWRRHGTVVKTTPDQLIDLMGRYYSAVVFVETTDLPADAIGLVCQGTACLEPARSLDQLQQQIQQSQLGTAAGLTTSAGPSKDT